MRLTMAALAVAALAIVMVWFPMARTTAMVFAFGTGFVVGAVVVAALVRRRSE